MKARRENDNGRKSTYQRTFAMTSHALQRFRERAEHEHIHLGDFELGNLLDERIKHSSDRQSVVDLRNLDAATTVYRISRRDDTVYYAIVRDMTVVTVLDERMLAVNFENGTWQRAPLNTPFTRDSLRGIVPEVATEEPAVLRRSSPLIEDEPVPSLVREQPEIALVRPTARDVALQCGERMADAMIRVRRARLDLDQIDSRMRELAAAREEAETAVATAQSILAHLQNDLNETINNLTTEDLIK